MPDDACATCIRVSVDEALRRVAQDASRGFSEDSRSAPQFSRCLQLDELATGRLRRQLDEHL